MPKYCLRPLHVLRLILCYKTNTTDTDAMAAHYNYLWCYKKEPDQQKSCTEIVLGSSLAKKIHNRNHAQRSCWVRPWLRRFTIFGAFHTPLTQLSTEDPHSFRMFLIFDIWKHLKYYQNLQKRTFIFDVTRYMNEKHILHILKQSSALIK